MNKVRRQRLQAALEQLEGLHEEIEEIMNEEQDAYDSITENLQGTMRAEQSYNCISQMEDVIYSLEKAAEDLEEMMEG